MSAAVYDVGTQDPIDYLVMELLEGETLAERSDAAPRTAGRTTSSHGYTGRFVRSMKEADPNRVLRQWAAQARAGHSETGGAVPASAITSGSGTS
jgi:hypothetical protein